MEEAPGGDGVGVLPHPPADLHPHTPTPLPGTLQGAEHFLVTWPTGVAMGTGADVFRTGVWGVAEDWGDGNLQDGVDVKDAWGLSGDWGDFPSDDVVNTSPEGFAKAFSKLTVMAGDGEAKGEEFRGWSGESEGGEGGEREEDWGCPGEDFCLKYWPGEGGSPSGMLLLLPNLCCSWTRQRTSYAKTPPMLSPKKSLLMVVIIF